jgi:hypothetical protein
VSAKTESPEDVRRFVVGLAAIGAARGGDTPEFGSSIADAAILAFVERDFWSALLFADTLLVLEDDHAAPWMTLAGVLRFHALQNLTRQERGELLKAESKKAPPGALRYAEGKLQ